jgi:hypothetical protein
MENLMEVGEGFDEKFGTQKIKFEIFKKIQLRTKLMKNPFNKIKIH